MELYCRKTENTDLSLVQECEKKYPDFVDQWILQQHMRAVSNPDMLHLIFFYPEDKFAGYAILRGLENKHHSIELVRVAVVSPGSGLGKRIIRRIMELCFDTLGANRLWLDVRESNVRAKHVYESMGFVKEGFLRESVYLGDGRYEALLIMSILRSEYLKAKP